jgi:plastocyanin
MKKVMLGFLLVGAFLAATCAQQGTLPSIPNAPTGTITSQGGGSSPAAATMVFGIDTIGSPFNPASGHDQSGHARDNVVPRNVVIDRGGTVTFKMGVGGVHQVAIYRPGTDPGDINTTLVTFPPTPPCPPVPLINDPTNRVTVLGAQACNGGPTAPTFTFNTPGKYLVICTFLPHFNVGMYGWVTVRD